MSLPDLATVEQVKAYLELEVDTFDTLLQDILTAASSFVRLYTRKTWTLTRVTEVYNGKGMPALTLARGDVSAVEAASIYQGPTYGLDRITSADQAIILRDAVWPKGRANVTVTYLCGSAIVPPTVQQAVVYLCALRYRQKDWVGISSRGMGPESVTFAVDELPEQVLSTLDLGRYCVPVKACAVLSEEAIV